MVDYSEQRRRMVDGHLRPCDVRDLVILTAAQQIQRENFLPDHLKSYAYLDDDIQLDDGHFMMRPNDLLRMIIALKITPTDRVLDIAGSTGYSSVILSFLGKNIISLEDDAVLTGQAKSLANMESVTNAEFVTGPYSEGFAKAAPYNAILLQRAYAEAPDAILQQLAEGGRLVYVKQDSPFHGRACLVEKHHGSCSSMILFEMCAPCLDKPASPGFSFQ